jgi:hypothetical protein
VSTWLVVWLVILLVATVAIVAVFAGLVRHVLVVGRAAKRFQEEAQPLAADIARTAAEQSAKAEGMKVPGRAARPSKG